MLMSCIVQAQDCNELYKLALRKYQEGDVQSAYSLLSECTENRKLLAKAEKNLKGNIYWLVTQSSILLKKNKEAKSYLKRMLALRPFYKPDKDDLQDVSVLLSEVLVKPRLSLRVMGGFTGTKANVIDSYEVFVDDAGTLNVPKKYNSGFDLDIMAGIEFDLRLNKHLSLGLGVSVTEEQFQYTYELTQGTIEYDVRTNTDGSLDTLQIQTYRLKQSFDHEQDLTYIKLPISLRYYPWADKRIEPYVEVGGYYGVMMGAGKTVTLEEVDTYIVESATSSVEQTEILSDFFTTDIKAMMVLGTYGWFVGGGVNVRLHRTNLFAGFRYQVGLNTIVQQNARYNFEDLTYDFYDIMDDIKLNSAQLFVGWSIPINYKAFDRKIIKRKR